MDFLRRACGVVRVKMVREERTDVRSMIEGLESW